MIALFTDFGTRDAYVAQIKGAIVSINPHAQLLDLTHDIEPFNIREAAYLLEQSTRHFPARTIVVAVVDPGVGSARRPIVLRTLADKFYVGPDNGLFTRVIESERLAQAYLLQNPAFFRSLAVSATFHGRDIFAPVAAHLARGISPWRFGPAVTDLMLLPQPSMDLDGRTIRGEVIHVDGFGNIVTNIGATYLADLRAGQQIQVTFANATRRLPFCRTYAEAPPGSLIGLINSAATFEVAVCQGRAVQHVAVQIGDPIILEAPG